MMYDVTWGLDTTVSADFNKKDRCSKGSGGG